MAKSPEEMANSMIQNLKEKTGRSLEEWLSVVRASGKDRHKSLVDFLKQEHGMTHGYANLVAHKGLQKGSEPGSGDLVGAQYAGAKSGLLPIYERLVALVEGLGSDVELSPKKSYVSLRRSKQFGLIQPSTKTRVDLGIQLKEFEPVGRLEKSGSFNAMVSHRVRLANPEEVDAEVEGWLRQAYERA